LGWIDYRVFVDPRTGTEENKFAETAQQQLSQAVALYGDDIESSVLARWRLALNYADRYRRAIQDPPVAKHFLQEGVQILEPIKTEHTTPANFRQIKSMCEQFEARLAEMR
jgi:hypothetical protein